MKVVTEHELRRAEEYLAVLKETKKILQEIKELDEHIPDEEYMDKVADCVANLREIEQTDGPCEEYMDRVAECVGNLQEIKQSEVQV